MAEVLGRRSLSIALALFAALLGGFTLYLSREPRSTLAGFPEPDLAEVRRLEVCVLGHAGPDCLAAPACAPDAAPGICAMNAAAARDRAARDLVRNLKTRLQPPVWRQFRLTQIRVEEARGAGCGLAGMLELDPARARVSEAECLAAKAGERLNELRELIVRLDARSGAP